MLSLCICLPNTEAWSMRLSDRSSNCKSCSIFREAYKVIIYLWGLFFCPEDLFFCCCNYQYNTEGGHEVADHAPFKTAYILKGCWILHCFAQPTCCISRTWENEKACSYFDLRKALCASPADNPHWRFKYLKKRSKSRWKFHLMS